MRRLRVLLVEDSLDDADLIRFELEDAGLPVEMRHVSNERGLREALDGFAPDVAISDLNLPGYCGLAALELVHDRLPALPLLLVSGAEHDEIPKVPARVLGKADLLRLPAVLAGMLAPA